MWSEELTLTTPGTDITFNASAGDLYFLDPTQCSWTPDLRVTADDAPRTHGAVIFPVLKGAGHLRLAGRLLPSTDTASARDTMAFNLEASCDAILSVDGTFTHPTRGALTVRCETYPAFGGAYRKDFVLVLIAATPTEW